MKGNKKKSPIGYRKNRNILVEKYGFIYFHLPKNGCTSFKSALFPHLGGNVLESSIHKYDFPFAPLYRITDYDNYMKFALTRNPWDRLVSCFKGKIRSRTYNRKNFSKGVSNIFREYGDMFYGDMSFEAFVKAVCSIPNSQANPHFISQLYWYTDFSGKLLPNYFGSLESLDSSIIDIYKRTGLTLNIEHMNLSKIKTPYTEYYDESLKQLVRNKFAGDIEIFGYEFGGQTSINPVGTVDDVYCERLKNSRFVAPIIKEKEKQLKMIQERKLSKS